MAAQPPHENPLSLPSFESKLPPEFLHGLDERGRYLYTAVDEMRQAQEWFAQWAVKQDEKVEAIRIQTTATNGKVLAAQADIVKLKEGLKEEVEKTAPAVKAYGVMRTLACSRVAWIITGLIIFVLIPWMSSILPGPATLVKLAVRSLLGA